MTQQRYRINGILQTSINIRHERIGDTLARSTFDNGAQILVNYGDAPQTVDGVTVPAAGFVTLVDGKITEGEA